MKYKYGTFDTVGHLWEAYKAAMLEAWRVLRPQGYLIFKCQDFVHGRQQFLIHADLIVFGRSIGFYAKDLFIKTQRQVPIAWNHNEQAHARKFHCYFLVFQKKIRKVRGIV